MSDQGIVNINFGEVGMYLPRSTEAIQTARKLLDMLEISLKPQIRSESDYMCNPSNPPDGEGVRPQGAIGAGKEFVLNSAPIIADSYLKIPMDDLLDAGTEKTFTVSQSLRIPKFTWDKTKEKSYDKLFFF